MQDILSGSLDYWLCDVVISGNHVSLFTYLSYLRSTPSRRWTLAQHVSRFIHTTYIRSTSLLLQFHTQRGVLPIGTPQPNLADPRRSIKSIRYAPPARFEISPQSTHQFIRTSRLTTPSPTAHLHTYLPRKDARKYINAVLKKTRPFAYPR